MLMHEDGDATTLTLISRDVLGEKTEAITVPDVAVGEGYKVRAISLWLEEHEAGEDAWDESDANFSIIE